MRLVWAKVAEVVAVEPGLQTLLVTLDDGRTARAVNYLRLSGSMNCGDAVLVNTTAVDLGLGTGGSHFVVARSHGSDPVALDAPSGGHIMKLRYTPMQTDVVSVEAPESPHHDAMSGAVSLEGMPVVCCGLHSQMPLVAAGVRHEHPDAVIAYCMTDGAALLAELSGLSRQCRQTGLVDAVITCGQASGGDFEAVNLHSGLLAARHVVHADVAIVAIGPGVVGTATPFGHGGIAQGEAINAAAVLGGGPIACVRMSLADRRERHRGVSHHTLAALDTIAMSRSVVPIPLLEGEVFDGIAEQLTRHHVGDRHDLRFVEVPSDISAALRGIRVSSMGRFYDDDPVFFQAAFAAGLIASF